MIIIDAQLSPSLALWITQHFKLEAYSAKYLGLEKSNDLEIFMEARTRKAIVLTKDEDFVKLVHKLGSPPKIIWVTCGNTSTHKMKDILIIKTS